MRRDETEKKGGPVVYLNSWLASRPKPHEKENSDFSEEDDDLGEKEVEYNQKVDALGSLLSAAEVIIGDIGILAAEVGLDGEREAWLKFVKRWEPMFEKYEEFWKSVE